MLIKSVLFNPVPKDKFNSSKLKEFADDNYKFDKNGKEFSKRVEDTVGKQATSPFPTVFSKDFYCRNVKTRVCLGKGSQLSHKVSWPWDLWKIYI